MPFDSGKFCDELVARYGDGLYRTLANLFAMSEGVAAEVEITPVQSTPNAEPAA